MALATGRAHGAHHWAHPDGDRLEQAGFGGEWRIGGPPAGHVVLAPARARLLRAFDPVDDAARARLEGSTMAPCDDPRLLAASIDAYRVVPRGTPGSGTGDASRPARAPRSPRRRGAAGVREPLRRWSGSRARRIGTGMYRARSREPSPAPRSGRGRDDPLCPASRVRLAGACGRPWVNASATGSATRASSCSTRALPVRWSAGRGSSSGTPICAPSGWRRSPLGGGAGSATIALGHPAGGRADRWRVGDVSSRGPRRSRSCWAWRAATDGDARWHPGVEPGRIATPARRRPRPLRDRGVRGANRDTVPASSGPGAGAPHRRVTGPAATAPARPHRRRRRRRAPSRDQRLAEPRLVVVGRQP